MTSAAVVLRSRYPRASRWAGTLARAWRGIGHLAWFTFTSVAQIGHALRYYRREVIRLIAEIGMGTGAMAVIGGTVAIVGFVTLSGGSLIAIQGFASLGNIGVEAFTGFFAALVNVRIAAPVVSGTALAATVGAGATAELGAMRISEEIDALEVMGINSISYLVSTRMLAGFVVVIPLYAMAILMSFLSAQITTTFFYGQSLGTYEHYFRTFLRANDVGWSFVQAIVISIIVMLAHCYFGYWAAGGPVGVGEAVGRSMRASLVKAPLNTTRRPPYNRAAVALIALIALVVGVVYAQFRGDFTPTTTLTMIAARAGLLMDTGSKVTFNGVEIGRVASITLVSFNGAERARLRLDVDPEYVELIPANVHAEIKATTVFGNKYVSLSSPQNPTPGHITTADVIDAIAVTTEFNTLFETITSIAEKIDPVKLNTTLSAAAQALGGLGTKFGQSLVNGNEILADLNPQMPQIRYDTQRLVDLADIYTAGSPDLWNFLGNAVTTSRSFTVEQRNVDAALLAAVGFGNTGTDIFTRAAPYLVRGAADLTPTASLLDKYSPQIFCGIRNIAEVIPKVKAFLGNNGYSLSTDSALLGSENPYIYPDNLPRINAKGGPGGRPGCWATITRDLWPAPYLVMDTGASIAPYNHFAWGQPLLIEYVWGRQVGEDTINP